MGYTEQQVVTLNEYSDEDVHWKVRVKPLSGFVGAPGADGSYALGPKAKVTVEVFLGFPETCVVEPPVDLEWGGAGGAVQRYLRSLGQGCEYGSSTAANALHDAAYCARPALDWAIYPICKMAPTFCQAGWRLYNVPNLLRQVRIYPAPGDAQSWPEGIGADSAIFTFRGVLAGFKNALAAEEAVGISTEFLIEQSVGVEKPW